MFLPIGIGQEGVEFGGEVLYRRINIGFWRNDGAQRRGNGKWVLGNERRWTWLVEMVDSGS